MCICAALAVLKLLRCQALCKPYTVDVEKANSSYLHYMEKISLFIFRMGDGLSCGRRLCNCDAENRWQQRAWLVSNLLFHI